MRDRLALRVDSRVLAFLSWLVGLWPIDPKTEKDMSVKLSRKSAFTLIHDSESAVVMLVWKSPPDSNDGFPGQVEEIQQFVKTNPSLRMVINTRALDFDAENTVLDYSVLLQLRKTGVERFALLPSDYRLHYKNPGGVVNPHISAPIAYFEGINEAIDWLSETEIQSC